MLVGFNFCIHLDAVSLFANQSSPPQKKNVHGQIPKPNKRGKEWARFNSGRSRRRRRAFLGTLHTLRAPFGHQNHAPKNFGANF